MIFMRFCIRNFLPVSRDHSQKIHWTTYAQKNSQVLNKIYLDEKKKNQKIIPYHIFCLWAQSGTKI